MPPKSIVDMPSIPDDGHISLATVARAIGGGDPDALENSCRRKGIHVESSGSGWGRIAVADLETLIGATSTRTVMRSYKPEMTRFTALGGVLGVHYGETLRLAELRGVLVDKTLAVPEVSRSGAISLRKILDVERDLPIEEGDWFEGVDVRGAVAHAMRTHIVGPESDDVPADRDEPRQDPDASLLARCGWSGVRWRRPRLHRWSAPGRVQCCGFDLYRLLGVAAPGADVALYLEKMTFAYEAVFPSVVESAEAS